MRPLSRHLTLLCTAITLCLAAPAWSQDSEEDAFKLARNLYKDADYATTAVLFAEFIRNYPASEQLAEARLLLARSYGNSRRCDLAIKAYETFYQEHPDHWSTAEARQERAACLAQEGRHLDAASAYEEVQRLRPASEFAAQVLLNAAANYTYGDEREQASRMYHRIIAEYSTQPLVHRARYHLAGLLFASGKPDAGQELLEDIVSAEPATPEAPSALLLAGRIALFLGRLEEARTKLGRLHQRFPATAQADSAYLDLASNLYDRRQFSQAGDAFQTAWEHIGDGPLNLRARRGLADARRQSGQTQVALEHYQALLKELPSAHPESPRARLGLAITYGQTGKLTAAVELFHQLIQADQNAPEAIASFRELGVLYQDRGDYTQAISWYNKYLQAAPEAPNLDKIKLSLARIYTRIGYYEQAISVFRELAGSSLAAAAQLDLAQTFEQNGQPRVARSEYMVFLERFPAHRQTQKARDRIEYLNEFTVMDAAGLNRVYQQILTDELIGTPRQIVLLDLAQALYEHHDIVNAARIFETYVAAYPDSPYRPKAQFYLAESLLKLARQRQLEERPELTDSLRQLALQEHRILADAAAGEWSQKTQIRLIESSAEGAPDSLRYQLLEEGFAAFIDEHADADNPHQDLALLRLGDARRYLGERQPAKLDKATETYRQLQQQFPQSGFSSQALFGLGLCHALQGEHQAAADSLARILRDYPGSPLSARVLFELGQLLLQQGQWLEAKARFRELLLAYPAFPERRDVQLQLAHTHYQLGEYARAVALYRGLLEGRDAGDVEGRVLHRLAEAYHLHGQFEAALDMYHQILVKRPQTAGLDSIYFTQAVLLDTLQRKEEAIRQFLQVRDDFNDSPLAPQAAQRAGHLLFALERYQLAYETYQPLLTTIADPQTCGRAVLSLFRLQRLSEARKAAKTFAKRFDEDPVWPHRFQLEEGQYYLGQKNYEQALKQFRKLEKQEGAWSDDGAYYAAVALWEQNLAAPSEESAARALEAQTRFIANYPDSPHAADIHLRLGHYYFALHQYLLAAGAFKAVVNSSAAPQGRQQAIWMLLESYKKVYEYDEAYRTAARLLREFPAHPKRQVTELEIGIILKETGRYAEAIAQFEKVLEWARGNHAAEALFYTGESHQNLRDYRAAIQTYFKINYYGADASAEWITTADYKRGECYENLNEFATAISVYQKIIQREGADSPYGQTARKRVAALRQRMR